MVLPSSTGLQCHAFDVRANHLEFNTNVLLRSCWWPWFSGVLSYAERLHGDFFHRACNFRSGCLCMTVRGLSLEFGSIPASTTLPTHTQRTNVLLVPTRRRQPYRRQCMLDLEAALCCRYDRYAQCRAARSFWTACDWPPTDPEPNKPPIPNRLRVAFACCFDSQVWSHFLTETSRRTCIGNSSSCCIGVAVFFGGCMCKAVSAALSQPQAFSFPDPCWLSKGRHLKGCKDTGSVGWLGGCHQKDSVSWGVQIRGT